MLWLQFGGNEVRFPFGPAQFVISQWGKGLLMKMDVYEQLTMAQGSVFDQEALAISFLHKTWI